MHLVDTNVLVYAAKADCEEHVPCHQLLEEWRASSLPWFTTWPIAYELLRIVTHPKVLTSPWTVQAGWGFLEGLLSPPGLSVLTATHRHREVARRTFAEHPNLAGNVLHDAHTAILMREHGIRRIYTRDGDFRQFPFLEVLDPLSA